MGKERSDGNPLAVAPFLEGPASFPLLLHRHSSQLCRALLFESPHRELRVHLAQETSVLGRTTLLWSIMPPLSSHHAFLLAHFNPP